MVDITDLPVPGEDISGLPAPQPEWWQRGGEGDKQASNLIKHARRGALAIPGALMTGAVNTGNLLGAGIGAAKQALGFGVGDNLTDPANVPLTSQWLQNKAAQLPGDLGAGFRPDQEQSTGGRMLGAAFEALPSAALGMAGGAGAIPSALTSMGYGAAGQGLHEAIGEAHPTVDALAQGALMFGPAAAGMGTRAWAAGKLKDAVASNPSRSTSDTAGAAAFGGPLTVAQTTNSGLVRTLSRQAMGQDSANVGQTQADFVANKLADKARALAPLPVTTPGVSARTVSNIGESLKRFDTNLQHTAERDYQAGTAHVSALARANPDPVVFPSLTSAAERILGENADVWNTAPKELESRVRTLLGYLQPKVQATHVGSSAPPGARPPITTANAADALRLGKSLNQQFNAKERGALNQNMDEVFAELKAAYKQDLENAPSNPAIDKLREVNSNYAAAQGRIKTLQDSVVHSTVKALGTTDPDAALAKLAGMTPHAQGYMRDILHQYDPATLRALQGHYIDMHLNAASDASRPSMLSRMDIHSLKPGELIKTGIFDSNTVHDLQNAQGYINTIRNFFPEGGAGDVGVNVNAMSRIGGGVAGQALGHGVASPVFIGGAWLHKVTAGKLQKLLLTPEGRDTLMQGAQSPQAAMKMLRNIALYNNALSTPQPVQ
jgi:hypothetical protein